MRLGPDPVNPSPTPSPAPSSSAYETARTTQSDTSSAESSMTSNNTRPSRDRRPPERYGEFGQVAFLSDITPPGEPLTYSQALSSPNAHHWKAAM